MIEINISGAFAAIGFTHDIEQSPAGLLFDEEKLRQSRGVMELWERRYAIGEPVETVAKRKVWMDQ
jgi:hypothetical protein